MAKTKPHRCPIHQFDGEYTVSEVLMMLSRFPQDAKVDTTGIHVWGLLQDLRVLVGENLYRIDCESERLPWLPKIKAEDE